jgi:hypothetical protein
MTADLEADNGTGEACYTNTYQTCYRCYNLFIWTTIARGLLSTCRSHWDMGSRVRILARLWIFVSISPCHVVNVQRQTGLISRPTAFVRLILRRIEPKLNRHMIDKSICSWSPVNLSKLLIVVINNENVTKIPKTTKHERILQVF